MELRSRLNLFEIPKLLLLEQTDIHIGSNVLFDQISDFFKGKSVVIRSSAKDEDGDLIIAYGDIVYSAEILKELLSSSAPISVIIDQDWKSYWEARFDDILEDAETLVVNEYDQILEIGSKTTDISEIQGQYIGLIKITKEGKSVFRNEYAISEKHKCNSKKRENAYMTDFLQQLISKGYSIQGIRVSSPWIEIDQPKDMNNKITLERLQKIKKNLQLKSYSS